jgi:hypothetical protein
MNNQIILNARSNIKVTNKQKVPLLWLPKTFANTLYLITGRIM